MAGDDGIGWVTTIFIILVLILAIFNTIYFKKLSDVSTPLPPNTLTQSQAKTFYILNLVLAILAGIVVLWILFKWARSGCKKVVEYGGALEAAQDAAAEAYNRAMASFSRSTSAAAPVGARLGPPTNL